jgi:hypothetical protein
VKSAPVILGDWSFIAGVLDGPDREHAVRLDVLANVVVRKEGRLLVAIVLDPLPPVVLFVRSLDGDNYLCREVADALGVSTAMLRRLSAMNPDAFAPSDNTRFGRMLVRLYSMGEVDRLHKHLEAKSLAAETGSARRPGRPRLWTEAERQDRRARYCAAAYRSRRARKLADAGEHAASAAANRDAATIRDDLRAEYERAQIAASPSRAEVLRSGAEQR